MNRGSDSSLVPIREQLEHDRLMRTIDRLHDLIAQGAKGLGLLNAGAVVAMLAFVQALVDKPVYLAFKPYVLIALSSFLLGSFLAAIVFFFHHKYIESSRRKLWDRVVWGLLITSSVCAFVGGFLIIIGIYVAI